MHRQTQQLIFCTLDRAYKIVIRLLVTLIFALATSDQHQEANQHYKGTLHTLLLNRYNVTEGTCDNCIWTKLR
jgi:hypothetical protein